MKKDLIIVGAGNYGRIAYEKLGKDSNIIAFADNDETKQGKSFCNIEIIPVSNICRYLEGDVDIVVATAAYVSIGRQLKLLGINNYYVMLNGHIFNSHNRIKGKICRCNRCVMDDSSDDNILFDANGFCNYCTESLSIKDGIYYPNSIGESKLSDALSVIKEHGRNGKYDCIMGISGGLDSSYLAYLGYKWGLRVLAVHIDDGFDTDISANNIKRLIDKTGFEYRIIKPNAKQYCDLVLSYMKAGVPNLAVPQDNCLFAFLYETMRKNDIKYFLPGGNYALESILQKGNTHSAFDVANIYDIHNKFGIENIDELQFISRKQIKEDTEKWGIESPRLLNYINYNRDSALKELNEFCGFEYYGSKHLENELTAFIQLYWFYNKFGVDKRTSHLSSMIISGQMTREAAITELSKPLCDEALLGLYIKDVTTKLGITMDELEKLMKEAPHSHNEYEHDED